MPLGNRTGGRVTFDAIGHTASRTRRSSLQPYLHGHRTAFSQRECAIVPGSRKLVRSDKQQSGWSGVVVSSGSARRSREKGCGQLRWASGAITDAFWHAPFARQTSASASAAVGMCSAETCVSLVRGIWETPSGSAWPATASISEPFYIGTMP